MKPQILTNRTIGSKKSPPPTTEANKLAELEQRNRELVDFVNEAVASNPDARMGLRNRAKALLSNNPQQPAAAAAKPVVDELTDEQCKAIAGQITFASPELFHYFNMGMRIYREELRKRQQK